MALLVLRLDSVPLQPLVLTLPAEPESLQKLRTGSREWSSMQRCRTSTHATWYSRRWEAGANAIEHADAPPGATFHLDAVLTGDRVSGGGRSRAMEGAAGP